VAAVPIASQKPEFKKKHSASDEESVSRGFNEEEKIICKNYNTSTRRP
jgi:hypothetical protein